MTNPVVSSAIVPVAGRGSRMRRLTGLVPKELLPLVDRPVLDYVLEELEEAGVQRTVLVSHPGKPLIAEYVDRRCSESVGSMDLEIVHQDSRPGNGGAILSALPALGDGPVVVVWGDEVFLPQTRVVEVTRAHARTGKPTISLCRVDDADVSKCGIVEAEDVGARLCRVTGIVEKPSPADVSSRLASVGGFVLTADLLEVLVRTPARNDGEIYLSSALATFAREDEVYGVELSSEWLETGSYQGYAKAFARLADASAL